MGDLLPKKPDLLFKVVLNVMDIHPDIVSERLGIRPTSSLIRWSWKNRAGFPKRHHWRLDLDVDVTEKSEINLTKYIDRVLKPKIDLFEKFAKNENLLITVQLKNDENSIQIPLELMDFASKVGVDIIIEFDLT